MGNPENLKIFNGTISFWMKASNVAGENTNHRALFGKSRAYMMFIFDGILETYDWGTGNRRVTNINMMDNLWHHIAFVFKSGTNENYIFVDGVKVMTTSITIPLAYQDDTVKVSFNWSTQYFKGNIDEASIYNTRLTDAEIVGLYNQGNGTTI